MLEFIVDTAPPFAIPVEIAPGVRWVRLAIPHRLDHVNVYLLRDGQRWVAVDTGVDDNATREAWSHILSDLGGPGALSCIFITHHHPDHAGAAGWLQSVTSAPVVASQPEWEALLKSANATTQDNIRLTTEHFLWLGCTTDEALAISLEKVQSWAHSGGLPDVRKVIRSGEEIYAGQDRWRIILGAGHSPGPALLLNQAAGLLIVGDQVLPTISPYVGTPPDQPETSPLLDYLEFLDGMIDQVDFEPLILPGHGLPFLGLSERVAQLKDHHHRRCQSILDHCREKLTARELIKSLYRSRLDGVMAMALDETLSHVNLLVHRGLLTAETTNGVLYCSAISLS